MAALIPIDPSLYYLRPAPAGHDISPCLDGDSHELGEAPSTNRAAAPVLQFRPRRDCLPVPHAQGSVSIYAHLDVLLTIFSSDQRYREHSCAVKKVAV